jgi:hypothetical protein
MSDFKTASDYLASLDRETLKETNILLGIMQRISNSEATLWNIGTVGFDSYHYKYASGREGDSFIIGFYPRKGKITIYLMDGTARYKDLLANLGKHTTTGYCIVIKQLADIDLAVLEQLIKASYDHIQVLSKAGPIDRVLWQIEK